MYASAKLQLVTRLAGRKRVGMALDVMAAGVALLLFFTVLVDWRAFIPLTWHIGVTLIAAFFTLYSFQAHRHVWHRISLWDVTSLLCAAAIVAFVCAAIAYPTHAWMGVLRVYLGSLLVLTAAWIAPRLLLRLWWEARHGFIQRPPSNAEPVILYGSGRRAEQFIEINQRNPRYQVVGFLHESAAFSGRFLRRAPALGSLDDLDRVIASMRERGIRIQRIIVTEDGERPDELSAALEAAARTGLLLCRLPSMLSLVEPGSPADVVRTVSIEDILQREPVSLADPNIANAFEDKVVLVTGAGGSIGSELVRQIATCGPRKLLLVDFGEFNLFQVDRELSERFPLIERIPALCNIRDTATLERIFADHRPQIVLHAAALKHVPLLERHPLQAIETNVFGTFMVASLARKYSVEVFTLVSTDKAVNPTNVMGATKRWAEIICQAFDVEAARGRGSTRFTCVRFGNVLDSAGSVVPIFRQQIAQGGPVTVTHADITRYFMTIPEASGLILLATSATVRDLVRSSSVFVLDMGEPVRIMDLAERMIQLHGLRPMSDVKIRVVGLRPGEKIFEELAHKDELLVSAPFARASLANPRTCTLAALEARLTELRAAAESESEAIMIETLRTLVPEFVSQTHHAGSPTEELVAAE